jgi:chromate transporter
VSIAEKPAEADGEQAGGHHATLGELASLFFRLGTIAFGGPAAHIAMMEDEVVRRRRWLTRERFLDMVGACNLIPGPNSTEMAIHIGHQQAGFTGLVVAGACFIIPATVITLGVAWAYVAYGSLPQVGGVLYGVKPVIIAVVLQALWRLAQTASRTRTLFAVTALSVLAGFLDVNELVILFGAGAFTIAAYFVEYPRLMRGLPIMAAATPVAKEAGAPLAKGGASAFTKSAAAAGATVAAPFSLIALFRFFLKVGAVLFGSGYVLIAFLQEDLVDRFHWLTQAQLLDAVAVGQVTPGPVFSTATFIGYILGGTSGAMVATVGIFLPAFFFVSISGPLLPRLRRSPIAGAFLDGVNAGSLALMVVVTWELSRAAIVDVTTVVLAVASAILLLRFRVNSAWLVLLGAAAGALPIAHY